MGVNSEDPVDYPDIAVLACNEFKKADMISAFSFAARALEYP